MIFEGSQKYPVRGICKLLKQKALSACVNGLTDKYLTQFIAESYIPEGYYRNLDVLGDAVFFPLLDETSFKQEVWRYDLDENQKPFINGVVFIEMSSNIKISLRSGLGDYYRKIFHGSEIEYYSGGDFLKIPELTVDRLAEFHHKYYTPANWLLFLFGKIDLEEQLSFLEDNLLSRLPEETSETQIKDKIIPLPSMTEMNTTFPDRDKDKRSVSIYILNRDGSCEEDAERDFFFNLLCTQLEKLNRNCDIGHFCASTQGTPRHKYFVMTMSSVKESNIEKAKSFLLEALEHCLDNGFDYEELDSVIKIRNQKYAHPDSFSDCCELQETAISGWVERNNPFEFLFRKYERWIQLRDTFTSCKDEDFRSMLRKYLIDNPDKFFLVKSPDKEYLNRIEVQRKAVLNQKINELGNEAVKVIEKEKKAFEATLNKDESELINKLFPPLDVKEMGTFYDAGLADVDETEGKYGPVFLFSSPRDTNGKVYVNVSFALDFLTQEEMQQVECAFDAMSFYGFDGMNNEKAASLLDCNNIWLYFENEKKFVYTDCAGQVIYENRPWIQLKLECFQENLEKALELALKYIYSKNINDADDRSEVKEIISNSFSLSDSDMGTSYASLWVLSHYSKLRAYTNEIEGINSRQSKKNSVSKDINLLLDEYHKLYEKIINGSAVVNVVCEEQYLAVAKQKVGNFIRQTEIKPLEKSKLAWLMEKLPETGRKVSSILVPVPDGSLHIAFKCSPYPSKEYAEEQVVLSWFSQTILFKNIRGQHGAYGCSGVSSPCDNLIFVTTSQDPAPNKSLMVFEDCVKQLNSLENNELITELYVREIVLNAYSQEIMDDKPSHSGKSSFKRRLNGSTPEMRKQRIKYVFEMTRDDFIAAGKRIYENSKNLKACIVTGDEDQVVGEVICDLRNESDE